MLLPGQSSASLNCSKVRLNRSPQEKSTTFFKNLLDKTLKGGYNSTRWPARCRETQQDIGDLHSGSAVDSDSTCGSSILSSPTRKPSDSFRWLFCFISQCVFGPVRHKALIFSRLPGLYCFLMQQGMQQGNTEDRSQANEHLGRIRQRTV